MLSRFSTFWKPPGVIAWTPANITSATLVAWYDAENVVLVDTNRVSQMDDLSGSGNHAVQGIAADRPTWSQDGLGRGRITFAGLSPPDHMQIPSLFTGSAQRSVFLFCQVPGDCRIFCLGATSIGQKWHFVNVSGGGLRIEIQGSGYTSALVPSGEKFMGLVLAGATLGNHTLHLDGASASATGANAVDTAAAPTGENAIGNGVGTTLNPITTLREVVACAGVLSPAEIAQLRNYVTARWAS